MSQPICVCGDWKSDHTNGAGPCILCNGSRHFPWDSCHGFTYWRDEEPMTTTSSSAAQGPRPRGGR